MFRIVKGRVFSTADDFKITKSIVFYIMILVMNNFVKFKFSSKMSFHFESMFSNIFRFSTTSITFWNPYKSISKIIKVFSAIPMTVKTSFTSTFKRTKSYFMTSSSVKSITGFFAVFTWGSWDEIRHNYTIDGEMVNVN